MERFAVGLRSNRVGLAGGRCPFGEADRDEADGRAGRAHLDPRGLVDVLPDPLVVIDSEGMVRWGNTAATEQLGWRLADWVGLPAMLLVHPDDVGSPPRR